MYTVRNIQFLVYAAAHSAAHSQQHIQYLEIVGHVCEDDARLCSQVFQRSHIPIRPALSRTELVCKHLLLYLYS